MIRCRFWVWAVGALLASSPVFGDVLFKYSKKDFKEADLPFKFRMLMYEVESKSFETKKRIFEDAALDQHFREKAQQSGQSVAKVTEKALEVKDPSDKELKEFYEKNKKQIPYPFDQVKGQLVRYVKQQAIQKKRSSLIEKIKKKGGFAVALAEPLPPQGQIDTAGFYQKGDVKAKVEVVEFADYKCPHCKQAAQEVKKLLKKHGAKINFVFVDYPIMAESEAIAEGSHCAKKQKKFWEYHVSAFDNQGKLKTAKAIAADVGVDNKAFEDCMKKGEGKALVEKGKKLGESLGISGTPAVFINGYRYKGHYHDKELVKAVSAALAGKPPLEFVGKASHGPGHGHGHPH